MPTYEYRCPEGHEFELFQRISDEPGARCPTCGAESERMLSGGAGFLFKGEGFYATDYRSESYKKEASKEGRKESGAGAEKAAAKKETTGGGSSGKAPESAGPDEASGSAGTRPPSGSKGDGNAGAE